LVIEGVIRCEGGMANPAGPDLLRLVTWLANEGQSRTGGLKAGDWVTTGSWTGKLYAMAGDSVEVNFAHFGKVAISFE
jgi:2-keto-4-pentenoate hydratase